MPHPGVAGRHTSTQPPRTYRPVTNVTRRLTPNELTQRIRLVNVDDVHLLDGNPNQGDVGAIHTSMEEFGQIETILVAEHNGRLTVVNGNHRVVAERQARRFDGQLAAVDVTGLDWTDIRALAAGLALNRTGRLGHDDPELLSAALLAIQNEDEALLTAAGWTLEDLDDLLLETQRDPAAGATDEPAPTSAPAVTKPGDVWLLGPHRVLCGDCRDPKDVARLLDDAPINLAFTSPPYASQRTYDETSGFKPIPPDRYVEWFDAVQANVAANLADDGSWFVNIKEHAEDGERADYVLDLVLAHRRHWAWRFIDTFVWPRPGFPIDPLTVRRFKNAWEPVYHFAKATKYKFTPREVMVESDHAFTYDPDKPMQGSADVGFVGVGRDASTKGKGMAYPSNVLPSFGVAATGSDHTAAFPVGLPAWFVKAYTDPGDTVYDPFLGSGSTLIAAHQEGRIAYGTEISAGYVDIICKRWQQATGDKPIHEASGEPVDFCTEEVS